MSVTFIDGPAADVSFEGLARCPIFLRVTYDQVLDNWDALDQLDDQPMEAEQVHVYRRVQYGFACARGRGQTSGEFAVYKHVELDEATLVLVRETERWRQWTEAAGERGVHLAPWQDSASGEAEGLERSGHAPSAG